MCVCVRGEGGGGGQLRFFDFLLAFLHHKPTAKMSTLKGKNFLPVGANLSLLE